MFVLVLLSGLYWLLRSDLPTYKLDASLKLVPTLRNAIFKDYHNFKPESWCNFNNNDNKFTYDRRIRHY